MNLTPWDVQSKRIYNTDDVAPPLYSAADTYIGPEIYVLIDGKGNDTDTTKISECECERC